MESLDKLLANSADEITPKRDLSLRVTATIRVRKLRRNIFFALGLGVILAGILALFRGHLIQMLGYVSQHSSTVAAHPGLFARSVAETLPLPIVITILLLGAFIVYASLTRVPERLVRATFGLSVAAFTLTGSATALAYTTSSANLGPAQQQLERVINGIGKTDVSVNGKTYEIDSGSGISDEQIRARADFLALIDATAGLDTEIASDGGTTICACKIISSTPSTLTYTNFYSGANELPLTVQLDSTTHYYRGATASPAFTLSTDEFIFIDRSKDLKRARVIALPTYSASAYDYAGPISNTISAHGTDGRCYNNIVDACPNLPAVYDYLSGGSNSLVPADAEIREVYGQITFLNDKQVKIKTSSGAIWTFNIGNWITAPNDSGFYDNPEMPADHGLVTSVGDNMRVEFWQRSGDLNNRTVNGVNPTGPTTKSEYRSQVADGTFDATFQTQIRGLQVALSIPWYGGMTAVKFK